LTITLAVVVVMPLAAQQAERHVLTTTANPPTSVEAINLDSGGTVSLPPLLKLLAVAENELDRRNADVTPEARVELYRRILQVSDQAAKWRPQSDFSAPLLQRVDTIVDAAKVTNGRAQVNKGVIDATWPWCPVYPICDTPMR